jgi:hypothetical protein
MPATLIDTMTIFLASPYYTIENMGSTIKNTHRMLLKFIYCNYNSDSVLTFTLYFKRRYTDLWENIPYVLDPAETYFKMKLPPGVLCREAKFEISAAAVKAVTIFNAGILGKLKRVGVA